MEKYNIKNLNAFFSKERNIEEVYVWFDGMAEDYISYKESEEYSENGMFKLVDFWQSDIQNVYGDTIYNLITEHWAGKNISLIADIQDFLPRYFDLKLEAIKKQMTEIELEEAETLVKEIWETGERFELSYSFYDYIEDAFVNYALDVPRLNREDAKVEMEIACYGVLFNRGNLLVKIFKKRGQIEYVAIKVDEDGFWTCLNEDEVLTTYHDSNNNPLSLGSNEKVATFRHPTRAKIFNHKQIFEGQYS